MQCAKYAPLSAVLLFLLSAAPFTTAAAQSTLTGKADVQQLLATQQALLAQAQKAAQAGEHLGGDDLSSSTVSTGAAAKRAGVSRIGVVLPSDATASPGETAQAEALRASEMQLLSGPGVETVKLHAQLPEQALAEAKAQGCDYLLTTALSQAAKPAAPKSAFGRLKSLASRQNLQMATSAAMFIPGVQGVGLVASMLGSQLFQTNLLPASKNIKADAEVTLSYKLTDLSGATAVEDTQTAHAGSNGENVLTPMLTAEAAKVLGVVAGSSAKPGDKATE